MPEWLARPLVNHLVAWPMGALPAGPKVSFVEVTASRHEAVFLPRALGLPQWMKENCDHKLRLPIADVADHQQDPFRRRRVAAAGFQVLSERRFLQVEVGE